MTKDVDAVLMERIRKDATTLATCWKVKRRDGVKLAFTDLDVDIDFNDGTDSLTYKATSGYQRSAITKSMGLSVDNINLTSFFSDAGFTEADIAAGKLDGAELRIFMVDYNDLTDGRFVPLLRGFLGEATHDEHGYEIELRSLTSLLQRRVTRPYTANCTADLGDSRCKVDLTNFSKTTTIANTTDARNLTLNNIAAADNFYTHGLMEFLDGANEGVKIEIKSQVSNSFELYLGIPLTPTIGDQVQVIAGCNKKTDHCINKFDNIENYRGFPDIPSDRDVFKIFITGDDSGNDFFLDTKSN